MKKYFITGLVILLPVALTLAIVIFIFNLLTVPFLGIVQTVFNRYHWFEHGILFLSPTQIQNLVAQLLILISLFFLAAGLGFIARWFFFKTLIIFAEYIVQKIPFVSAIYNTCQDVIKTLFTSKTKSFKQVVLVPFPNSDTYSIGFITNDSMSLLDPAASTNTIAIFVPTAPNPTSGFLMMYQPKDIIYLEMRVEEAFKFIISCGMIVPPIKAISKDEAALQFDDGKELNP